MAKCPELNFDPDFSTCPNRFEPPIWLQKFRLENDCYYKKGEWPIRPMFVEVIDESHIRYNGIILELATHIDNSGVADNSQVLQFKGVSCTGVEFSITIHSKTKE